MESEAIAKAGQAYIGVDKVTGAIQFTVPQGTTLVDAIKALAAIDLSALKRIPRGCPACLCGNEFNIRERFAPVINVKLGH